jgi:carbonic anhydrase
MVMPLAMIPFPQQLIDGYRTFASQRLPTEQSRYRDLSVRGQSPEAMVIGCCDSRVSPEVIFDAGPGELFVVRNVANLVPVYQPDAGAHGVSAALEYAVSVLRVKHIVVLGHAQCGGIRAFIDKIEPLSPGDFIGKWMAMFIKPGEVVEQRDHETMHDFTVRIEKAAVFRSLENLMTFPFVRTAVERGELDLHGAYFGVAEGTLFVLDREAKEFRSVQGEEAISEYSLLPIRPSYSLFAFSAPQRSDSAKSSAEITNTRCTATSQVIRVASNAASMFKNASSTWIAEIATIDASIFCFRPAKSILVIQIGQFGWPVVSIRDTKFS